MSRKALGRCPAPWYVRAGSSNIELVTAGCDGEPHITQGEKRILAAANAQKEPEFEQLSSTEQEARIAALTEDAPHEIHANMVIFRGLALLCTSS